MKKLQSMLICMYTLFLAVAINAQQLKKATSNDAITLAQAYMNLSLTNTYFDTLDLQRLSKILPFEESELSSIKDPIFIRQNSTLYNFAYSLLQFNEAQLLFRDRKEINRSVLMQWKQALEKTVDHFTNAEMTMDFHDEGNPFYDLINFNYASRDTLHHDIFKLKRQFGLYFNADIYPDFKRIFRSAQTLGNIHVDSLSYFAGLYDLELPTPIVNMEYDATNYDYGPHVLPGSYEYRHYERDDRYRINASLSTMHYLLDPKLDLISRYVQLKYLASEDKVQSFDWFDLYRLYNSYFVFRDDLTQFILSDVFQLEEDVFFKDELNPAASEVLYQQLQSKFSEDSYTLSQAFINLSILNADFDAQSDETITEILSLHENKVNAIQDPDFISENYRLYHFTRALLYYNTAKWMFRTKGDINRDVLIQWKDTLHKGIESFNRSREGAPSGDDWEQDPYYKLIKYDSYDEGTLKNQILALKQQFTPYFNADIYPDFKRIFYEAKNSGGYDFEGLLQYSKLYNFPLSLSILNNEDVEHAIDSNQLIGLPYQLDEKLDLISKYLQLKYLATDEQSPVPMGFNVGKLYSAYRDFNYGADRIIRDEKDKFFEEELNAEVRANLYDRLQGKFPFRELAFRPPPKELGRILSSDRDNSQAVMQMAPELVGSKYFFPNPAPFPSARLIIEDFKPGLTTLSQVDTDLSGTLDNAGYAGQLHYYYDLDGFALATSLEKFNTDGSAVPNDRRFVESLGGDGKFSYFEIFKSIFFDVESEFRMFAFVVASKAATTSDEDEPMTAPFVGQLLENSYPSLPEELKSRSLQEKKLTVLVYHFHQDDIGEVPMLDVSGEITAEVHLKNAGLIAIINE